MARQEASPSKKIDSTKHTDKRKNIPTKELRDFMQEGYIATESLLYARDPSLDPQLVWEGKDAQDSEDLAVPSVPIYIQEKVHPQALAEEFQSWARETRSDGQPSLFRDFNGLEFEELIEFYSHDQNWTNRMILGDSLLVMNSLAEREGLRNQVQMIYIDPPYGIDFRSNWQVSTRRRSVVDGRAEHLTRQPEQILAFRDTWKLGVHSYLAYLRDRLVVAKDLLTESGSIFVQIGEKNVHLVRCLLDEVFGPDNSINTIVFMKTSSEGTGGLPNMADYLLWYGKDAAQTKRHPLHIWKTPGGEGAKQYVHKLGPKEEVERLTPEEMADPARLPKGWKVCRRGFPLTSQDFSETRTIEFVFDGQAYHPGRNRHWSLNPEVELPALVEMGRVYSTGRSINAIMCLDDLPTTEMGNVWVDTGMGSFTERQVFVVQTSEKVVQRCILMSTDPGDLVLDPTCGGGTTAVVAEQWGRRWITIDTSRVAITIARTRVMSAVHPYYLLADTDEGIRKEYELIGEVPPSPTPKTRKNIKLGFVNNRAPHRSLSDVARKTPGSPRVLYDDPITVPTRLRVGGPFTVESLSPHRVLSVEEERPRNEEDADRQAQGGFERTIIEYLREAGVQNTFKGERLLFDRIETFAGEWIQAEGRYSERDGTERRAAITIGPEHGTVSPQLVKEAAKEAVKGVGFDVLIICGFAFDPHVSEEAKRYGELTVLAARMNPDLTMSESLLKKTGTVNMFMIFGEPDIEIKKENGTLTVQINGLDIYDPTTGEIRANKTEDIACWFIDTDYNGESFFVRHAYFIGDDAAYSDLKRTLRVEVRDDAWDYLYSVTSRPFDLPASGRIAVKVINHYGDEVLKVYEVG